MHHEQESLAPFSAGRMRALRRAQDLAQLLIREYGDQIVALYSGNNSCDHIVDLLPLEITEGSKDVTLTAVKIAIRQLIPFEVRQALIEKHVDVRTKRQQESGHFSAMGSRGAHAKMAKLSAQEKRALGQKGALARGQTPWNDEERTWALANLDQFKSPNGHNYTDLADQLNQRFHNGNNVRGGNIGNTIRYFKKKNTPT